MPGNFHKFAPWPVSTRNVVPRPHVPRRAPVLREPLSGREKERKKENERESRPYHRPWTENSPSLVSRLLRSPVLTSVHGHIARTYGTRVMYVPRTHVARADIRTCNTGDAVCGHRRKGRLFVTRIALSSLLPLLPIVPLALLERYLRRNICIASGRLLDADRTRSLLGDS